MAAASEAQECPDETKPTDDTESEVTSTEQNIVKLEHLKVADLKNELEKRDLDKIGVKSVLVERLKAAIVEEGKNPEEYGFDISCDSTPVKSSSKKLNVADTPEAITTNDEINNSEEKLELQLSLDEEEAQLNEESLIEVKPSEVENSKVDDIEKLNNDFCVNDEKSVVADKLSSPQKTSKSQSEDVKEKKLIKTPLTNKSSEATTAVSPKVLKVIGKSDKLKSSNILAKSLWVTGLPNTIRAADLKTLFSKQGKVLSVKIVKSAKQTPAKSYGIVTMATSKEATKAIQNLHRIELNGKIISVERKSSETTAMLKKSEGKLLTSTPKKGITKKETAAHKQVTQEKDSAALKPKVASKVDGKTNEKKNISEDSNKKTIEKPVSSERSKDKDRKPRENRDSYRGARRPSFRPRQLGFNSRPRFENFRRPFGRRPFNNRFSFNSGFRPRSSLMDLQKMREDHFQRDRLRERREAERRREDEMTRHRYIERKQREEAYRLEKEKEKLRIEREFLERERAEIIKLEREKQRLERERLEREREELRRQAELRRSTKRPFSRIDRDHEQIWEDRKKPRYDVRPNFRREASSGSRFEFPSRDRASFTREFAHHPDKYNSQKHLGVLPRSQFVDREARHITIRPRADRQIFSSSEFRDNRRSLSSREQERHSSTRREPVRSEWKHERRVQERVVSSNSSSGRRMTYY